MASTGAQAIAEGLCCGKPNCQCHKPGGNGRYQVHCPAHPDGTPSLSIIEDRGKVLVRCHAGCEQKVVIQALKEKGLWPDGRGQVLNHQREVVATYDYTDAGGNLLYQVLRYNPKSFSQRRPDGKGGWISNLDGVPRVLYHLPGVLAAEMVYVLEGEKDADRLHSLGLTATTNPGGAGKWRPEYSECLKDKEVFVIPDNDTHGRNHASQVAQSLKGIARSVKIIELPGLPPKGDVSDWLDAGGKIGNLPKYAKEPALAPQGKAEVALLCMADVQAEDVTWLWLPYIPKGKLTLLEGDPGVGKSWVSLAIATAVSLGKGLPGQVPSEPATVVLASAEDGLGDTIRPRLDAMGADVKRIFAIDGALVLNAEGFVLLESYLKMRSPTLVVIDPMVAYLGATVDIHRANETRAVMAQLARLAEKNSVAILAVRHLTKGVAARPIYRGLGSIDFTAACRSVLLAGCDAENPQSRGVVHIKSNLAPVGPSIGYELREGGFFWTGESTLSAGQILAAEDSEGQSAIDEAIEFLKDELGDGPVEAKRVFEDARSAGITDKTLNRAKLKLGIISRREGESDKKGGGRWLWEMPGDLDGQDAHIKKNGHLNQNSFRNVDRVSVVGHVNPNSSDVLEV